MPLVGQFGSLAGLGSLILPGGAMESIATVSVGSGGASSMSFSGISGSYQHLQLRMITRSSGGATRSLLRFNSDTGGNYTGHFLYGNGASVSAGVANFSTGATSAEVALVTTSSQTASVFSATIIDILDYASTSKNKTVRVFNGYDANGSGEIVIYSAVWMSTAAVTAIDLLANNSANFGQHTTAALYGLRAP